MTTFGQIQNMNDIYIVLLSDAPLFRNQDLSCLEYKSFFANKINLELERKQLFLCPRDEVSGGEESGRGGGLAY